MDTAKYPHEKIADKVKRKARATVLPAASNSRLAHKSTPSKLCLDRKISRAPGKCEVRTHL